MGLTSAIFPVFIPSRKRPNGTTANLLRESNVPFVVFVEPREQESYRVTGDSLCILPANDRGLPFSRNFILDFARGRRLGWFWMLDDDITRFYRAGAGKCLACGASDVLGEASAIIARMEGVGQSALEYQQFAWSAKQASAVNGYCDVAVAIHSEVSRPARYREGVALKEDRDFTLQVLASGGDTRRLTRLAFACPKNGSNAGGLSELYAAGRESESSRAMERLWGPDICRFKVKSDGRPDVAINWKFFRPGHGPL